MEKREYKNIGESLYNCTLENGLKINVVPKPGFSTCYAVFATNYGGAHRRFRLNGETVDTPAGVAHFLEHKMFDLPGGDNALNILSANGADPNAFTSSGITCYYFQCTDGFEENLRMLLHFVSTPYFTDETVEKEQGIIAQEIMMGEDSPDSAVYYNLMELLYKSHPVRDKVAGSVESIAQITADTLYSCHKAFYAPSNMALCVEGDVDPEMIERIAREELPTEKAPVPVVDYGEEESALPNAQKRVENMEVAAPLFLIGSKIKAEREGQAAMHQHLISRLALRVLCGSSSSFYSRLYAQGILNRNFDYDIDFSAGTGTIIIGGESPEPEQVLTQLQEAVQQVTQKGFDETAFLQAKRSTLGSTLRGLEDFDNVCVALAVGIFEGYNAFDSMPVLESITKKECEDFVTENLAPERLALSIIQAKAV
jgi:predicted Zn-dependent peptidase